MKNLRKLISEILKEQTSLKEAAYTPENFPPDVVINVNSMPYDEGFSIEPIIVFSDGKTKNAGQLTFFPVEVPRFGPCHDAFEVKGSSSKIKGLGPLLYDIAIDISSHLGGGLMSDRDTVSPDAKRVWSFIEKNRSDIIKKQLDNLDNELTQKDIDNCDSFVAEKDVGEDGPDRHWSESPLSKVAYRPGMPVIKKLIEIGKIRFDNRSKSRLGL
jgi:hypothetical protein